MAQKSMQRPCFWAVSYYYDAMAHIHEKIDFTAEVFVVFKNRVLLRKHDKYKVWLSVGGHIELDEDPNEAAIREVKEEVSLDIELLDTRSYHEQSADYHELIAPRFLNRHRIGASHEHITLSYFATSQSDVVTNDSDEISDGLHWFTLQELDDPKLDLLPRIRFYAKAALAEIGQLVPSGRKGIQ